MYLAASEKDADEVLWLIQELKKHWPDISDKQLFNGGMNHVLSLAILKGSVPILRTVLEAGCDVNCFDGVSFLLYNSLLQLMRYILKSSNHFTRFFNSFRVRTTHHSVGLLVRVKWTL